MNGSRKQDNVSMSVQSKPLAPKLTYHDRFRSLNTQNWNTNCENIEAYPIWHGVGGGCNNPPVFKLFTTHKLPGKTVPFFFTFPTYVWKTAWEKKIVKKSFCRRPMGVPNFFGTQKIFFAKNCKWPPVFFLIKY